MTTENDNGVHNSTAIHGIGVTADPAVARELAALCGGAGTRIELLGDHRLLVPRLEAGSVAFVILDARLAAPGGVRSPAEDSGTLAELLCCVRRLKPGATVIVLFPAGTPEELKRAALEAGASDFLHLPLSAAEFAFRIRAVLRRAGAMHTSLRSSLAHEEEIRNAIGEIMLREYETLYVLGKASEYKDRETGYHIARVAQYSRLIARMIGEPEMSQDAVFHASALHDIGKIGIPDSVLLKPGKLTGGEFELMKTHSMIGHGILKNSQSSYLLTGAMIALTHHEKFDGTGYPMKLCGREIPLYGRIVGIADVFDALTTKRPYKEPWPLAKAFELLASERGKHFDPYLVDAFLSNSLAVEEIYHANRDTEELVGEQLV